MRVGRVRVCVGENGDVTIKRRTETSGAYASHAPAEGVDHSYGDEAMCGFVIRPYMRQRGRVCTVARRRRGDHRTGRCGSSPPQVARPGTRSHAPGARHPQRARRRAARHALARILCSKAPPHVRFSESRPKRFIEATQVCLKLCEFTFRLDLQHLLEATHDQTLSKPPCLIKLKTKSRHIRATRTWYLVGGTAGALQTQTHAASHLQCVLTRISCRRIYTRIDSEGRLDDSKK